MKYERLSGRTDERGKTKYSIFVTLRNLKNDFPISSADPVVVEGFHIQQGTLIVSPCPSVCLPLSGLAQKLWTFEIRSFEFRIQRSVSSGVRARLRLRGMTAPRLSLTSTYKSDLCVVCGVSLKDRCRNSDVWERCGVEDVVTGVERVKAKEFYIFQFSRECATKKVVFCQICETKRIPKVYALRQNGDHQSTEPYLIVQRTKLSRSELPANDAMRRSNGPRPTFLRLPIATLSRPTSQRQTFVRCTAHGRCFFLTVQKRGPNSSSGSHVTFTHLC
ncbi:hypothetical protein EVAR_82148_1 [Eumeta japonica]|uniref:Uncharacterized protein n=1 Tax=Eumeta variegata TaxID=151549 RepID=A0A4C1U2I6_EUMVA|nr:hypothetical protein EVAR_82148_1 [Eumeta japonica]